MSDVAARKRKVAYEDSLSLDLKLSNAFITKLIICCFLFFFFLYNGLYFCYHGCELLIFLFFKHFSFIKLLIINKILQIFYFISTNPKLHEPSLKRNKKYKQGKTSTTTEKY